MLSDLKFTLRRLAKNKFTTTVNLIGLAMGIFVGLALASFAIQEYAVDSFHSKSDRILKSVSRIDFGSGLNTFSITFGTLADEFKTNLPEVENTTRIYSPSKTSIDVDQTRFNNVKILRFDYSFFEMFDFEGVSTNSFSQPHHAIISKEMAETMFDGEAVGKQLIVDEESYTITAISDIPNNTIFQFDLALPVYSMPYYKEMTKGGLEFETYVLLNEGADLMTAANNLSRFQDAYTANKWPDYKSQSTMLPLSEVYINDEGLLNKLANGDAMQVKVVISIAIIVLFLALINYVNLQISSNHSRSVELKLKRVMGADKKTIIKQGVLESIILMAISALAALVLLTAFYEYVPDQLFGKSAIPILSLGLEIKIMFFGILLLTAIVAGIIPASSLFRKGYTSQQNLGDKRISKTTIGMVLFQFFITTTLLTTALFITKQMDMIQKQPKGYDSEQVLMINNLSKVQAEKFKLIKSQLESHASIFSAGGAQSAPGSGGSGQFVSIPGKPDTGIETAHIRTLEGYAKTLGLTFVNGSDFTNTTFEGGKQFILNETAAALLFPTNETAVGQTIDLSGRIGNVVGVVKDFHFLSMKYEMSPLILNIEEPFRLTLMVRLDGSDVSTTLNNINRVLTEIDPKYVFEYQFLDDRFASFYINEIRTQKIITHSMAIAFSISIMGLLGLSLFVINNKLKEIAIRKVLGGSSSHIFMKLSNQLIIWILAGGLVSLPLSFWIAKKWVADFVYQIDLMNVWWMGILSSTIILIAGLVIIMRKLFKTIHMNPVIFLSCE